MARLCFGSFSTVIKLCSGDASAAKIVNALVGTIDPDNDYEKEGNAAFKLLNCEIDFSKGIKKESGKKARSRILELAKTSDKKSITEKFKSDVIPLIKEDNMEAVIHSILFMIENDTAIDSNSDSLQKDFEVRTIFKDIALGESIQIKEVVLPNFLANTLLYIVNNTKNKSIDNKMFVKEIKEKGFLDAILAKISVETNWNKDAQTLTFFIKIMEGDAANDNMSNRGESAEAANDNISNQCEIDEASNDYLNSISREPKIIVKYNPASSINLPRLLIAKKNCKTFEEFLNKEIAYIKNNENRKFEFDIESNEQTFKNLEDIYYSKLDRMLNIK